MPIMNGNKHETEAADVASAGPCVPLLGRVFILFIGIYGLADGRGRRA